MSDQNEKRDFPRAELVRLSHITVGKKVHECQLKNISATGAMFEIDGRDAHPFNPQDMVGISITDMGELRGKVLRTTPRDVAISFLLSKPAEKQLVEEIKAALA